MASSEHVSPADQLRDPQTALLPDVRADFTAVMREDGSFSKISLEDRHDSIREFTLLESVPLNIRVHFETAKNLYLYAWFVYRFFPVAEKHALATLEFALRERLSVWMLQTDGSKAKVPRGLRRLISLAMTEKLISNDGLRANERLARQRARYRVSMDRIREMEARGLTEMAFEDVPIQPLPEDYAHDSLKIFEQNLPMIRNTYAHGSSMLHPTVLGTFEIVTDLVNQLFPLKTSADSN
ncbi:MAG TPA: hypothetical protein VIM63_14440 [Rhodoferax sp.]